MSCILKGSFWLPFFFSLLFVFGPPCLADDAIDVVKTAQKIGLSSDPTWHALLHYVSGKCLVTDSSFLLNPLECSPESELDLLLKGAFSADPARVADLSCRFPARVAFIAARLKPFGITVPFNPCKDLLDYEERAPAEVISLVFAAENITQPMSMMGHVFIKLEGKDRLGQDVAHAVSFFAQTSTVNIPSLIADSLVLGLPSFFALVPYSEQIAGYREREKRNIWEYTLKVTDLQRRLIHLHVWELRTTKSDYLFVGYNCATVVYFLISLANPELLQDLGWSVYPIDVVRHAQERGVLAHSSFVPSLDWQIHAYGHEIGLNESQRVVEVLQGGTKDEILKLGEGEQGGLRIAFASALVERESQGTRILGGRAQGVDLILEERRSQRPLETVTIENLKDPLTGPKSSRFTVGAVHVNGIGYSKFELLPASHSLSDDNRHSYSESALELAEVSLLYNPSDGPPIIEKANIYALESLVPYDPYIGGLSSRLIVGAERQWDSKLSPFTAGHVTMGVGKTFAISEDARLYGTLNGAGSYGDGVGALSYFPEVGGLLYEILSMKTVGNYRLICGQHEASGCYQQVSLTQALLYSSEISPYLRFDTLWNDSDSSHVYEVGVKRYF